MKGKRLEDRGQDEGAQGVIKGVIQVRIKGGIQVRIDGVIQVRIQVKDQGRGSRSRNQATRVCGREQVVAARLAVGDGDGGHVLGDGGRGRVARGRRRLDHRGLLLRNERLEVRHLASGPKSCVVNGRKESTSKTVANTEVESKGSCPPRRNGNFQTHPCH